MNAANDNGRPCAHADVTPGDMRKLYMLKGVIAQIDLATVKHLPPESLSLIHEAAAMLERACADERERRYNAERERHRREAKFAQEERAAKESAALESRMKRLELLQKFRGDTATICPE